MPAAARPEPEIARAIPAQPQWNSSAEITCIWPSESEAVALNRLKALEALLTSLFYYLPGRALFFVVLARGGTDHVAGEGPGTIFVVLLLVIQCEIHPSPSSTRSQSSLIDWSVNESWKLS